ncbi:hypothetical protein NMY22_g11208 [Coprinellus aureogranulatus]|nr:hypothetical protein NMY22_g11208 [Coprinellus aureogranulatus]
MLPPKHCDVSVSEGPSPNLTPYYHRPFLNHHAGLDLHHHHHHHSPDDTLSLSRRSRERWPPLSNPHAEWGLRPEDRDDAEPGAKVEIMDGVVDRGVQGPGR